MKIINLVKCEFIKNYTFKKIIGVLIILIFSVVGVTESQEYCFSYSSSVTTELDYFENEYQFILEYPSEDVDYQLYQEYILPKTISAYKKLLTLEDCEEFNYGSWQLTLTREKISLEKQLYFIDKYLNKEFVSLEWLEHDEALSAVKVLSNLNSDELLVRKDEINNIIKQYDLLITENKFYKYVEYEISKYENNGVSLIINDTNISMFQEIVNKKIESERHYYVLNIYSLLNFVSTGYDSKYVEKIAKEEKAKYKSILEYAIKNDIKHDLSNNGIVDMNSDYFYMTSKKVVNQIFSLSIVIMILVILTSGDIVSKEHSLGTERMIMTSPNKRWKILLSKFIYMVLNVYIMWFIALLLLSIYASVKYGVIDLFTPKLIYFNNKVIEVNYYLFIIIKLFYVSIPVISLITLVFMLSTITLNTTITVGIAMAMTVISPFLWYLIQQFKIILLAYTPIPYFMFSQVINLNVNYLKTMEFTMISESYGIFISILTIVVCYIISLVVYIKRDVKN